jgi:hypothetical protein
MQFTMVVATETVAMVDKLLPEGDLQVVRPIALRFR